MYNLPFLIEEEGVCEFNYSGMPEIFYTTLCYKFIKAGRSIR